MKLVELYYSDTCHDCHDIRRILREVLPQGTKFKEINTSYPEGKERAAKLGILSVPTVAVDGEVLIVGRATKEEIIRELRLGT
ncbi:MAG TPA: thioredoxin [Candidatus Methanoperedenaceae archaeon]|nr:thioredoxin [Candidatus Methanoperedenaceae archaeon]